jgi:hypothetical protein
MTSRRWSTLVSGLVLTLALAAGGPARAQSFGFQGIPGYPSVSQFGSGYGTGTAAGIAPDYGSFGEVGYGGLGRIGAFPLPGYGLSIGRRPQTTTSFQSVSNVITTVPGWFGRSHRIRRRHSVLP